MQKVHPVRGLWKNWFKRHKNENIIESEGVFLKEPLDKRDIELIEIAYKLVSERKSPCCNVGSAIKATSGKIYTGVNLKSIHSTPCSMCAEYPAIGLMYKEGDEEMETVVAVDEDKFIKPPCGGCRELIRQFGDPYVILQEKDELFKTKISQLIPYWQVK